MKREDGRVEREDGDVCQAVGGHSAHVELLVRTGSSSQEPIAGSPVLKGCILYFCPYNYQNTESWVTALGQFIAMIPASICKPCHYSSTT